MMTQLELVPRTESQADADAGILADYLYLQPGWKTRAEISAAIDWPDWRIRHASEAANGDIIFGQRGLRHLRHGTPEEVSKCIHAMEGNRDALDKRILNTRKKYHSFGGTI